MLKAMVIQAARQIRAAARTKGPPRDTKDSFRAGQQRANVPFAGDCRRSHWRNTTRKSRELTASNSDCESSIARPGASSSRQMAKPFNIHQLALPPTPQVDWDFSSMRSIGHCCEYILPWGLRGKEILSSRRSPKSVCVKLLAVYRGERGRGGEGERGSRSLRSRRTRTLGMEIPSRVGRTFKARARPATAAALETQV